MVVFPGGKVDPVDHDGPDPVRRCAIRETEEETGVAAGGGRPAAVGLLGDAGGRTAALRHALLRRRLPAGQQAADVSGETDLAEWSTPAAAVAAQRAGRIAMLPPTLSILLELVDLGSVAAVREAAVGRVVERVLPEVIETADGWRFRYPDAPPRPHDRGPGQPVPARSWPPTRGR